MKLLNFDTVLCISPHPDDVEYSMSNTITKYTDTKFIVLCLSNGGQGDSTTGENRTVEARAFWDKYPHLQNLEVYFPANDMLRAKEYEWVGTIENDILVNKRIQCIMSTSQEDTHLDHRIAASIVSQLSRKNIMSIIEYRSPSTTKDWVSNLTIPMTEEELECKTEFLISSFVSQTDALYFDPAIIKSFHVDFYDFKRGIEFAEFFKIKQLNYF